ncbi:Set6p [Sugiyamaella lignohabitans]|uniref:Set6p n=1 Tax=Sugiyamaella lignohabitans TaxID=796027 RepID=A0A167CWH8_9ASCO|nr:Set6p [Sugiyamaella lignohabitans]ANB12185.1 Set6p [Sugiyamaella lignohabitans]
MLPDKVAAAAADQYLSVRKTEYGGRGYFAAKNIPANTRVLTCRQPLTYVVFKSFKKEVCAYCFSYDNGKHRKFRLVSNLKRAYAGVYFCSEECRDCWVENYDYDGLLSATLEEIELAYIQLIASTVKAPSYEGYDSSNIDELWDKVEKEFADPDVVSRPSSVLSVSTTTSTSTSLASSVCSSPVSESSALESVSSPVSDSASLSSSVSALSSTSSSRFRKNKKKKVKLPPLDGVEYDTARVVALVLVQNHRVQNGTATSEISHEWTKFNLLQSNELSHIGQYREFITVHVNVYKFLRTVLQDDLRLLCTPRLLRDTVGREAGNAFGIWELPMMMESECFGTAVYPAASFFNHECEPSVRKQRVDNSLVFTTIRDIAQDEQLFISYGMMEELPYPERQRILTDQWHFDCQCPACTRDKLESLSL